MLKSWKDMWKNTFNYTGTVTRKGYWLALIMNVLVMYAGLVPYALVTLNITDNAIVASTIYLIIFHLPALSIYFRRAKDAGWRTGTTVYLAITIPVLSGLIAGLISNCGTVSKGLSFIAKIFALSFGLFFYGGVLGIVLYNDPTAMPIMPITGISIASLTLIIYGIIHWKAVLAFLSGSNMDKMD